MLSSGKPEKVFALVTTLKNALCLEPRVLGRVPSWPVVGPPACRRARVQP